MMTEHALLVPLGHFAQQIGLLDALKDVPINMKTIEHQPGEKLAEVLAHILAGGMHITELARGAHPLIHDAAAARAWGQERFASSSGVSALLASVTPADVAALRTALQTVLAPWRDRLLHDLSGAPAVVDGDLTGLVVSDQARTYAGAAYGYMGEVGGVAKGYQFARVQLQGTRDTLVLGGILHPGDTLSVHCVRELVVQVEATLGRPRRRTEVVEQRLAQAEEQLGTLTEHLATRRGTAPRLKARQERLEQTVATLRERRDDLAADNATLTRARRIILRLDGGFGNTELIAWLYEQGYDFVIRQSNYRIAAKLKREEGLHWEKISKNGFIAECSQQRIGQNPYPMRLFACRRWQGAETPEYWSCLVVNPELEATEWSARRVGVFYNGRQSIEAGIKEGKGILSSRHLPTRNQPGIALYQELVLLAQNLLRWFRRQVLGTGPRASAGIKELVHRVAKSRALVQTQMHGVIIRFLSGPWHGTTLCLPADLVTYQLWLPVVDT
jgi:hypothetical protein